MQYFHETLLFILSLGSLVHCAVIRGRNTHRFYFKMSGPNRVRVTKSCQCGLASKDINERAVVYDDGVSYAQNHAWPWMVSIVNVTEHPEAYCGGSLISDSFILTAAHCIPRMMETGISNFLVYLGTNYINNDANALKIGIKSIVVHPKFDYDTADFDIALMELKERVKISEKISPVCLIPRKPPQAGDTGIITGWGSYNLSEPIEDQLKQTQVTIVGQERCRLKYDPEDIPVTENMMCAKSKQVPCKGDSGSPLVTLHRKNATKYSQVGIISHGQTCSGEKYPTIYSRVIKFIDWIQQNTFPSTFCYDTFWTP